MHARILSVVVFLAELSTVARVLSPTVASAPAPLAMALLEARQARVVLTGAPNASSTYKLARPSSCVYVWDVGEQRMYVCILLYNSAGSTCDEKSVCFENTHNHHPRTTTTTLRAPAASFPHRTCSPRYCTTPSRTPPVAQRPRVSPSSSCRRP